MESEKVNAQEPAPQISAPPQLDRQVAAPSPQQVTVANSPQIAQMRNYSAIANGQQVAAPAPPNGGLPTQLRSGIEALSGIGMGDVRVHLNSSQPAQLRAHAFAKGSEIHVAPGQERHLPHEAWHVVQQKQNRVKPTLQLKGIAINDDSLLEREADVMGAKAMQLGTSSMPRQLHTAVAKESAVQRVEWDLTEDGNEDVTSTEKAIYALRSRFLERISANMLVKTQVKGSPISANSLPVDIFAGSYQSSKEDDLIRFEEAAWGVIDKRLPELLDRLPFPNAQAAILFSMELFQKYLFQNPSLLDDAKADDMLDKHLLGTLGTIDIGTGKRAVEEDESGELVVWKSAGAVDKRYRQALLRVASKGRKNAGIDEGLRNAEIKFAEAIASEDEKFLSVATERFLTRHKEKEAAANAVIAALKKCKLKRNELRCIILLNSKDAYAGHDMEWMMALDKMLKDWLGLGSNKQERIVFVDQLELLGLLTMEKSRLHGDFCSVEKPKHHPKLFGDLERQEKERNRQKSEYHKRKLAIEEQNAKDATEANEQAYAAWQRELEPIGGRSVLEKFARFSKKDVTQKTAGNVFLLKALKLSLDKKASDEELIMAYEDYFAAEQLPPGEKLRCDIVDFFVQEKLLGNGDPDILKFGAKSGRALVEEALAQGWLTSDEFEVGSKLLGPTAFLGIIESHMRRGKPGPFRSIVEQIREHRSLIKFAPPLKSTSLALDTNMVEAVSTPYSKLYGYKKELRDGLNTLIIESKITDLRLANMNIAELSSAGRLLGTIIPVEVKPGDEKEPGIFYHLPILAVPYNSSRGSGKYDEVFKELQKKAVGENKGDADRSMLADLYLADREKDAVPHLATADKGITDKIGNEPGKFDPIQLGLPDLDVHLMAQKAPEASPEVAGSALEVRRKRHPIWDYQVGSSHTIDQICQLILKQGYEVYVVGGAVRDHVRNGKIKDVDLKTTMAMEDVEKLMNQDGLMVTTVEEIRLVKVGSGDHVADITCTSVSHTDKPTPLDFEADARDRDFGMNALYWSASARSRKKKVVSQDPLHARESTEAGIMRFTADPGPDKPYAVRGKAILNHLKDRPEHFGRALKFIQRGYEDWKRDYDVFLKVMAKYKADMARYEESQKKDAPRQYRRVQKKNGRRTYRPLPRMKKPEMPRFTSNAYRLDSEILSLLRKNAVKILSFINEGADAPARKGLFIHAAGFKSPMEMVDVMLRLNFPPEAVALVYPDSVAGVFSDQIRAKDRYLTPRSRPLEDPSRWNPNYPPQVKVDTLTGRVYQYRMYARLRLSKEAPENVGDEEKLLIDVDHTDHGVKGHPRPHFHVYRLINKMWIKNMSGLSNTGQVGEPKVQIENGERIYRDITPWMWWTHLASMSLEPSDFKSELEKAAKSAGVSFEDKGDSVGLGGQITLSLDRLKVIAQNRRLTKLLVLLSNLSNGAAWNQDDDTVQELTGSRGGKERLRFKAQLDMVEGFLSSQCGIKDLKLISKDGNLTPAAKTRIYDLITAEYTKEECKSCTDFALRSIASNPDPFSFVSHFEFRHSISSSELGRAHDSDHLEAGKSIAALHMAYTGSALQLIIDDKGYVDSLLKNAKNIRFGDAVTASYHLHKHIEMTKVSQEEALKSRESLAKAAQEYMEIVAKVIVGCKEPRVVPESENTLKIHYELDGKLAIVEVDKVTHAATLLTCFAPNTSGTIFLSTPFLDQVFLDEPIDYGSSGSATTSNQHSPMGSEWELDQRKRQNVRNSLLASFAASLDDEKMGHDDHNAERSKDQSHASSYIHAQQPVNSKSQPADHAWFTVIRNKGGGDCLLHALEGKDLDFDGVLKLRSGLAGALEQSLGDQTISGSTLYQSLYQSGYLTDQLHRRFQGKHQVSRATYQKLVLVPGLYAGEEEIQAYCALMRTEAIYVVTSLGELRKVTMRGGETVTRVGDSNPADFKQRVNQYLQSKAIVLYKSNFHWERITGVLQ